MYVCVCVCVRMYAMQSWHQHKKPFKNLESTTFVRRTHFNFRFIYVFSFSPLCFQHILTQPFTHSNARTHIRALPRTLICARTQLTTNRYQWGTSQRIHFISKQVYTHTHRRANIYGLSTCVQFHSHPMHVSISQNCYNTNYQMGSTVTLFDANCWCILETPSSVGCLH